MENNQEWHVVQQTTITLPYLDDEVSALYLANGRPYIPVFAVCQALGIRADTHIPRWKHLLFWHTALKLPYQTAKRGKRLVWCLLISEVPYLYSMFDWKMLSAERRDQLYKATQAHMDLAGQAYQEMQNFYAETRRLLFFILKNCDELDEVFWQRYEKLATLCKPEKRIAFLQLVAHGRSLWQRIGEHARKMVRGHIESPIIDGVKMDQDHNVIDTFSMPLLPAFPREDIAQLNDLMKQISTWQKESDAFGM